MAGKKRVVESMKAAAALLGVDVELVRRAKEGGCPAFQAGNRIDVSELETWVAKNGDKLKTAGISRRDRKLDEEIRKLKIANDQNERLTVPKDKGMAAIANCQARIRTFLEAKLENEYPSVVVGMNDIAQIRVYGRKVNDQILTFLQSLSDEWAKI